jgi:membrane-bound lytic murein transglycosylase A
MTPFLETLHRRLLLWGLIIATVGLIGCAQKAPVTPSAPPAEPLYPVRDDDYPVFSDDMDFDELERGIQQSLLYYSRIPQDRMIAFGADSYSARHLALSLERFRAFIRTRPDRDQLNRFVRDHYRVYRSPGRSPGGDVLFTGYFEPEYKGSLNPRPGYGVPVFGLPEDLITVDLSLFSSQLSGQRIRGRLEGNTLVPYYTRRDIVERDALSGKAPVIAWLTDPVDLYILQVQGSGMIQTPEGQKVRLQYAGKNDRASHLVGRRLIEEGKVSKEEMSLQRIREYFRDHPEDVSRMLNGDPSFVFFRRGVGDPLGNIGVELTAGRSIATDSRLFPKGALAYIHTEKPLVHGEGQIGGWSPMQRFVLNQDTGGAIRGAGRVDLFWGAGPYAKTAAGHMKHPGDLYFLISKKEDGDGGL